jgi:hypothetical protein
MNRSFGEIIHTYTRRQAMAAGDLVDVTDTAREAGIRLPVALTRAVWEDCVAWSGEDSRRTGAVQDEAGRLWDVLYMTRQAIGRVVGRSDRATVRLVRVARTGRRRHAPCPVRLEAVCGPGDRGEPVITIMQPGED